MAGSKKRKVAAASRSSQAKKQKKGSTSAKKKRMSIDARNPGMSLREAVVAEEILTPFTDNDCNRTADSMNKAVWDNWKAIGKWYAVVCTVAAHWLYDKRGTSSGDTVKEVKKNKEDFYAFVTSHPLVKLESKRVDDHPKETTNYSKNYTERVWDWMYTELRKTGKKNKWVYKNKDYRGDKLIFGVPSYKYTFIWPTPEELEKRDENKQKTHYINHGTVEMSWYQKLQRQKASRDAKLGEISIESGTDPKSTIIGGTGHADMILSSEGEEDDSGESEIESDLEGIQDATRDFRHVSCPVPECPMPVLNGKIVKNLKILAVHKATEATDSSEVAVPGYLLVEANFVDVCTDLYVECGAKKKKIRMMIPQEHMLEDYAGELTSSYDALNKATMDEATIEVNKTIVGEAVVFDARPGCILNPEKDISLIRLTQRPSYIKAARKLEVNKTNGANAAAPAAADSDDDDDDVPVDDRMIFLPQSAPRCYTKYLAVVVKITGNSYYLELSSNLRGYLRIVDNTTDAPKLWSTIAVEIHPTKPFTYGPSKTKKNKFMRCIMPGDKGGRGTAVLIDADEAIDPLKFNSKELALMRKCPIRLDFDCKLAWKHILKGAKGYEKRPNSYSGKNFETSTKISTIGIHTLLSKHVSDVKRSHTTSATNMENRIVKTISKLLMKRGGLNNFIQSLETEEEQRKEEKFRDMICVQYYLAKKKIDEQDESTAEEATDNDEQEVTDRHIRFDRTAINRMHGKSAEQKAYVGFIPMTDGKQLTIRSWDKPWSSCEDEDSILSNPTDVTIDPEHLYILPAEAPHTEICDSGVDYLVLIITLEKLDDKGKPTTGDVRVKKTILNFEYMSQNRA